MKIVIVPASHSELGNTGKKTVLWLEEVAAPIMCSSTPARVLCWLHLKADNHPSIHRATCRTHKRMNDQKCGRSSIAKISSKDSNVLPMPASDRFKETLRKPVVQDCAITS